MDKFALFGNPIIHSISPRLHNMAIREFGFDGFYGRILLEDGAKLKNIFLDLGLHGANITVPHKEIALKACDYIDPLAQKIGAINTILKKDEKIYGYNTDAGGFLKSIEHLGGVKKALIIGAGGSARAIAYGLAQTKAQICVLNRSSKRVDSFKNFKFCTWDEYLIDDYDIVINTTSAGLQDSDLPLPKELLIPTLKRANFAYDVIYGKVTPFLRLARELNLECQDGADMLLFQAILAFSHFYTGVDTKRTEIAMQKAFAL